MNDVNSYEANSNDDSVEQPPRIHVENVMQQELVVNDENNKANTTTSVIKKILKYVFVVAVYGAAIASTPLAIFSIMYGLQEGNDSRVFTMIAAVAICLTVILVNLAIKKSQQLSQYIEQRLNSLLLIHSVVCFISLAIASLTLTSTIMMIIQINTGCEGSSCAAGLIVPAIASTPILPFAVLSIFSAIKMSKINRQIAHQMQVDTGQG